MHNYDLSVQTRRLSEIRNDNYTVLGPLNTVKLEAQRYTRVLSGEKIERCNPKGRIVVTPYDDFLPDLEFVNNEFEYTHQQEILLNVVNKGYKFIRINPDQHLFRFEWVPYEESVAPVIPDECPTVTTDGTIAPVIADECSTVTADGTIAPVIADECSTVTADGAIAPVIPDECPTVTADGAIAPVIPDECPTVTADKTIIPVIAKDTVQSSPHECSGDVCVAKPNRRRQKPRVTLA